ncbi:uncharacterized protein LOC132743542 [Ruditapes philippinarum]|uniref:uncharacterized protein LOC132743542 n=1 Tax=Ruditapes philippinarum TaxID=129788 RepID=UPI00295A9434|nr:uncharacterized protein LOC132743542 [Ruditapes philippinarum]
MNSVFVFVLLYVLHFQYCEGQTTKSVSAIEGVDVNLSCDLTGVFTLPTWRGPPGLLVYTLQDDVSEAINPVAPAASRLQYASNKKDLVLSNAYTNDSGIYRCSYTGIGDHTITLSVTAKCQTAVSVSATEGDDVTLPCTLTGSFTLPVWRGPPGLLVYTLQDDVSEAINPVAPAASRLQYASNEKDLVLSDAQISDSGDYRCSYTALGNHTITLTVTAERQTAVSVSATEGDDVTLPCTLTGSFTLPAWTGPPNALIYTNQDDPSEAINPAAPAASRLQYASNKKDLVLSNAYTNDSGSYRCSYTALGNHTITLTVTAEQTEIVG